MYKYFTYKTTNIINNKYYFGAHKTKVIDDGYYGSGKAIKKAIIKYGKHNFKREILSFYDNEEQLYAAEIVLIEQHLGKKQCYNLMVGGVGSFSKINQQKHLYINPMHNEECKKKNLETRRKNDLLNPDRVVIKKQTSILNLKKAIQHNTGRKRPRQSAIMKDKGLLKKAWMKNKEEFRDKLSNSFIVISPENIPTTTNRLTEFCSKHNLPFVSLWCNTKSDKKITKGKAKGWRCIQI